MNYVILSSEKPTKTVRKKVGSIRLCSTKAFFLNIVLTAKTTIGYVSYLLQMTEAHCIHIILSGISTRSVELIELK